MTEKRFTDDGVEEIVNQSFTDNLTGKTYWIDNGLDEIIALLNKQDKSIFLLKSVMQTITAESRNKNISHKRILEIKKHWYDKLYGDD